MRRALFTVLGFVIFAIAGLAAVMLWYLLYTTDGARLVLRTASRALDGSASIALEIKSGCLAHGFDSEGPFVVEVPGTVRVSADSLSIRYSLRKYLLTGTLVVDTLKAPSLEVKLISDKNSRSEKENEQSASRPSDTPFRVDIPVKAVVRHIYADNFAYRSDVVDVLSEKTDLSASCGGDYAGVLSGKLDGVDVHLKYQGDGKSDPLPLVKSFGGDGIEPFDTIDLPLDTEIRNLSLKSARYHMDGFDTGIFDAYVDAGWKGHLLEVKRIGINHEWGHAGLSGKMDFSRYFGLDFKINYHGAMDKAARERFKGALAGLEGRGTIKGDLTDLSVSADNEAPGSLKASARINTLSGLFPFEAKASSDLLVWPLWMPASLAGSVSVFKPDLLNDRKISDAAAEFALIPDKTFGARVSSAEASLSGFLNGTLKTVFSGTISGYGLSSLKTRLEGSLVHFRPVLKNLSLDGRYMGSDIKAKLDGKDPDDIKELFSGNVSVSSEDPHKAVPLLTGKTWAQAHTRVRLDGDAGQLELSALKGAFKVKNLSPGFSAKKISVDQNWVEIDSLELKEGSSRLSLNGKVGKNSELAGRFELANLSQMLPALSGSADGRIMLDGDITSPQARVTATSPKIRLGTHEFSGVTLSASADIARNSVALTLLSDTVSLAPGLSPSRKCALDLNGSLKKHSAVMSCSGRNGGFLGLDGGLDAGTLRWSGRVNDFILESEFADTVSLVSPVPLELNLRTLEGSVGDASLRGNGVLELSKARFSPKSLGFEIAVKALNIAPFKKLLPEKWDLSGSADGRISVLGNPGLPRVKSDIEISNGRIALPDAVFAFSRFKFGVDGDRGGISFTTDAAIKRDGGNIVGTIHISDPRGVKRLSGSLKVDGFRLSRLRHLGGGFNDLDGTARSDLTFGGTLARPLIYGTAGVSGSAEPRYDIGRIDRFNFDLTANGHGGALRGTVYMNQGRIDFNGPLDWSEGARGSIALTSRGLTVFLLGYGECQADIDVMAKLDDVPMLTGNISIPTAEIMVNNFEDDAVFPSPDEVIVGSGGAQELIERQRKKVRTEGSVMDLTVALGSKVRVRAMGLKALAQGQVRLVKGSNDSEPRAQGQISLVDGHAELYGHRFLVSYAQSEFDGKITNPKIRAEVVADPSSIEDDVIAGVRVKGTVSDPSITLFSRPAMSQNEILSYLLYGHGLEKTPENPESSSSQLLLALGLGTTSGLMNSISDAFGMRNLQFGSSGSGENTQVGVQGYLTNRIMISYGYGVFSSVGEFRLRYELMRKLYAEFISSVDQAVDLVYSFDFN